MLASRLEGIRLVRDYSGGSIAMQKLEVAWTQME